MEIDIRSKGSEKIDKIRFSNPEAAEGAFFADILELSRGDCDVWLRKSEDRKALLGIKNKDVALNLIAAINKAIDLGWFNK